MPAVVEQLVTRADGIPLFAEELTQTVVEAGVDAAVTAIPVTLQDSLLARLDRISSAKDVAQRAAVLGREFAYALLAAVAGMDAGALHQGLARLVEAELVFVRGEPPEATYTKRRHGRPGKPKQAANEQVVGGIHRQSGDRVGGHIGERFIEARAESRPGGAVPSRDLVDGQARHRGELPAGVQITAAHRQRSDYRPGQSSPSDTNTNDDAQHDADGYAVRHRDEHTYEYGPEHPDAHDHPDADAYAHQHANGDRHVEPNRYSDTHTHRHSDQYINANRHPDQYSDQHPYGNSNADADRYTDQHLHTDADSRTLQA